MSIRRVNQCQNRNNQPTDQPTNPSEREHLLEHRLVVTAGRKGVGNHVEQRHVLALNKGDDATAMG